MSKKLTYVVTTMVNETTDTVPGTVQLSEPRHSNNDAWRLRGFLVIGPTAVYYLVSHSRASDNDHSLYGVVGPRPNSLISALTDFQGEHRSTRFDINVAVV